MISVGEVRPIPPQHTERFPFTVPRWDPREHPRRSRTRSRSRGKSKRRRTKQSFVRSLCDRVGGFFHRLLEDDEDEAISSFDESVARRIGHLPLPTPVKQFLFDSVTLFLSSTAIKIVLILVFLILLMSSPVGSSGGAAHVPYVARLFQNMFTALDTEEWGRPGMHFYEEFNEGSSHLPNRHPVVIVPGFVTTGLEIWESQLQCMQKLGINPSLRHWMFGPSMLFLILRDPVCWVKLFTLDASTGLDQEGVRIRGGQGAAAVGKVAPGYWVWEKIIRNLADIGYDESNLRIASYDWRLSPEAINVRDGYFHRLRHTILASYEQHKRPVSLIGHSYATTVMVQFFNWAEAQEKGFMNKYVAHVMNIGGVSMGAPKSLAALLFGDVRDTLTVPGPLRWALSKVLHRKTRCDLTRSWGSVLALLPHPCLDYPNGILEGLNSNGTTKTSSTTDALSHLRQACAESENGYCSRMAQHFIDTSNVLPSLPSAPKTTVVCMYGVEKSTEAGYHVTMEDEGDGSPVLIPDVSKDNGVKWGDGDGTIPLLSLGYMCRAPNGWKANVGRVITLEFPHDTSGANLLDFRGGIASGDHVDIMGNYEVMKTVLRVASGVDERLGKQHANKKSDRRDPASDPQLEDRIHSNIDSLISSSFAEKCLAL